MDVKQVRLGGGLEPCLRAAETLGLVEDDRQVVTPPQLSRASILARLRLKDEHAARLPGESGTLFLFRDSSGGVLSAGWLDDDAGGIPGHVGPDGDRLAQACARAVAGEYMGGHDYRLEATYVDRQQVIHDTYSPTQPQG